MDYLIQLLGRLEPLRGWIVGVFIPVAMGSGFFGLRSARAGKTPEADMMASATAMLKETREQLVLTQARLEACLHQLDKLRNDGWRMQDAITELHAAATAARMRVHELENLEKLPPTVFAQLPLVLL